MSTRGRRSRRFVVEDCTVEYRKHTALSFLGGAPKVSPLINLSISGLEFVSEDLFDQGQRLDLKVMIPSAFRCLSVRAEVAWAKRVVSRASYRMGASFLDPPPEVAGLLRQIEERCWAVPDERKRALDERIARRYPLPAEAQGQPTREYQDIFEDEPPAAPAPEARPPLPDAAPVREPAAAADVSAGEETPPLPAPELFVPTPEPAEVEEAVPQSQASPPALESEAQPSQPVPIPLFELIAGIETRPDAGLLLQGVSRHQVTLPGITDRDCFALEVHDNTMRHGGSESFDRGDVVVFSPNVPARSGDLAFVIAREGGLFRQVFFDANSTVRLRPLNGWYPEQRYPRGEVQGLWKLIAKFESYLEK